jgi:channel protein (hemolysin III family)
MNVWTHLLGAGLFVWFGWYLYSFPDFLNSPETENTTSLCDKLQSFTSVLSKDRNVTIGYFSCMFFTPQLSKYMGGFLDESSSTHCPESPMLEAIFQHMADVPTRASTELDKAKVYVKEVLSTFEFDQKLPHDLHKARAYVAEMLSDWEQQTALISGAMRDTILLADVPNHATVEMDKARSHIKKLLSDWEQQTALADLPKEVGSTLAVAGAELDKARSYVKAMLSDWEQQMEQSMKVASPQQTQAPLERWPIYVFLSSAIICLSCSFAFHLLYCKSEKVYRVMVRLDYSGVCCLIAGSYLPWLYYTFYCIPATQVLYISIISVLGITTFGLSILERFSKAEFVAMKAAIFVSFGLFAFVPITHAVIAFGLTSKIVESFFVPLLFEGGSYLLGALIFVKRFPGAPPLLSFSHHRSFSCACSFLLENYIPGYVDKLGQSHNLWHLFVLAGAVFHCLLCFYQFNYRQHQMCDTLPNASGYGDVQ